MVGQNLDRRPLAWIGLALLATNLPVVWKYLAGTGVLLYTVGFVILVVLVLRDWPRAELWRSLAIVALLTSLALQLVLLHHVAPQYDARMDRDDALVLWWQDLARGSYPYAQPTSLGNPISILPFLHLVALPFVILGNVGYLSIASSLLLALLVSRRYASYPRAQTLLLLSLATAPAIYFEVAGRSDLVANMLLFAILVLWVESFTQGQGRHIHSLPGLGLFIGLVAATRFALWPAIAVVTLYLIRHLTWRQAALALVCALVGFVALVAPLAVWEPTVFFGYAPLGVNTAKLGGEPAQQVLWTALIFSTTLLAVVYAWKTGRLFLFCIPVLACITLATWTTFFTDVSYTQLVFVPLLFSIPNNTTTRLST